MHTEPRVIKITFLFAAVYKLSISLISQGKLLFLKNHILATSMHNATDAILINL